MGINGKIGFDEANDTLEGSNKGVNYLAGRKGDDTYIINNLGKTVTYIDDAVIAAREDDENHEYWEKFLGDNPRFTPIAEPYSDNDTLQINNMKANDLLFFFDVFNKNAENAEEAEIKDALFVLKKSAINSLKSQLSKAYSGKMPSNGLVRIDAFFSDNVDINAGNDDEISYAENRIENIKVLQNGVEKVIDIEKYFKDTQAKVRTVLEKYGYTLASEMLMKANAKQRNELLNCYKTPMDLTITGTDKNDKIYAEAGSDTIVFDANSGDDIVYNTNSADKLVFKDGADVLYMGKYGNDLIITYNGGNNVLLSNYYKAKASDRLDLYIDSTGSEHHIKDETIHVIGQGKIYGTEYNDEVEGSEKSDKIYGGGGNDKLYGGWGNDIIYSQSKEGDTVLLAGEEGNDKLYGGAGEDIFYFGEATEKGEGKDVIYNANSGDKLRFKDINFEDLKFTKSGNNLVITVPDASNLENENARAAYKNFQATISNYFKSNDKLDKIEFIDEMENITTAYIKDGTIHMSGSGKIYGTEFEDVITGSKKGDKITTGAGDDTITAGRGNDTITLGAGDKTLNFAKGDGKDTIYLGDADSVKLNFSDIKDSDSLSYTKNNKDLVISHLYPNKKGVLTSGGTVTIKNYFDDNGKVSYENVTLSKGNADYGNLVDLIKDLNITGFYTKADNVKATVFAGTDFDDVLTYKSGMTGMMGGKGDDTYNVNMNKKTNVYISDILDPEDVTTGGGNDTLNIGAAKENLALLFNVNNEGFVYVNDPSFAEDEISSLYIFDKKSLTVKNLLNMFNGKNISGLIEIDNFFDDVDGSTPEERTFKENQYGYIENINVKGSDGSFVSANMEQWINQVVSEVVSWLSDHSEYSSAFDVLAQGDMADIKSLMNVYQTGAYQSV